MAKQGRTPEQLSAWAELLELCDDECQVFRTTVAMRESVLAAARELDRLHRVEAQAIYLAALHMRIKLADTNDVKWDECFEDLWNNIDQILSDIGGLIPGALDPHRLEAAARRPVETLVPRSSL